MATFEVCIRGELTPEQRAKTDSAGFEAQQSMEVRRGAGQGSSTVTHTCISGRARSREALRAEVVAILGVGLDKLSRDPQAEIKDADLWGQLAEHEDKAVREWFETIHGEGIGVSRRQLSEAEFWADRRWFEEAHAVAVEKNPECERLAIACLKARGA